MKTKILFASFYIGYAILIFGALQKILHNPTSDFLFNFGVVVTSVFVIISIFEVMQSKEIKFAEKLMWIIGLIFINFIVGLVYLIAGRKRIV